MEIKITRIIEQDLILKNPNFDDGNEVSQLIKIATDLDSIELDLVSHKLVRYTISLIEGGENWLDCIKMKS